MSAAATTRSSDLTSRPSRIRLQNYLLIWVDGNIDEKNEDCANTLAKVRSVVTEVNICDTPVKCLQLLNDLDNEKTFVISSGALGQRLVPVIHDLPQVDAIYIFCGNKAKHKAWTKEWAKIEGVFTSIKPICESLKKLTRQSDHDAIPMSFVPKQTAAITSNKENLNQLEPSFMYSVLFKEIILEIDEDDARPLKELVVFCRNKGVLQKELEEFHRTYHQKTPVWWYTCEIFLYGMLNYALRTLHMETMTKMGFFIRNLHRQLELLHKEQTKNFATKLIVYRGQGLIAEDFKRLMDSKGGLLAFNNFLSTSTKQQVAMEFVECTMHKYKDIVGVLFIMTIDPSTISSSTTPFALIDEYSAIETEKEILFSMHTVFRVNDIKQSTGNKRLWEVQLTLTDENDPQLATLTNRIKGELFGSTGWHKLGDLMIKVGHIEQAEELFNGLLDNASSESDRANIYHQLGRVKWQQGEYEKEVPFYEKSLEIYRKTLPEDHSSLTNTYNNIGLAYNNMGNYSKALEFYEKAIKIKEKFVSPNDPDLAQSYNNIGLVYNNMGNYSKALEFYEKSLKIKETSLPSNHPDLATSYNNIGLVYNNMGNYSKALEFHEKSLKIREISLPSNHPSLGTSYGNIGQVYRNQGNYSKALEFYEKELEIDEKALAPNHPNLAISKHDIGLTYENQGEYFKAHQYYQQAVDIAQLSLPSNHPHLQLYKQRLQDVKKKM